MAWIRIKLIQNYIEVLQTFTGNCESFFFQTVVTESLDCDWNTNRKGIDLFEKFDIIFSQYNRR